MSQDQVLDKITSSLLALDPVNWCEEHLTLDSKPYRINKNGYKPIVDILRYICIKGLEKNSLPVCWVKGRQVSGTTTISAAEMFFMGSGLFGNGFNPPIKIGHGFPTQELAAAYSKVKLNAMINGSIQVGDPKSIKSGKSKPYMQTLIDRTSDSNDSLIFKQFMGGNHMFVESVGIDGTRFMGKSLDLLFMDEIQKMVPLAVGNSTKTLTKAQYGQVGSGLQVYLGTPLQRGSEFWQMWNQSNQQYYHLGCEKCKKYFPLFTSNSDDWEKVWLYGFTVRCSNCGFEQDKRDAVERGKWVPTKDLSECKFIGFHLNQLYLPEFTKEKVIAEKPENNAINTEKTYQNEVLGNFWSGDSGIITPDQIREICGDPERKFTASISPEDQNLVFVGIDIGAKNDLEQLKDTKKSLQTGQSFSTAVVLSVSGPQRFSIEYATKFKRNDLASKKGIIDQIMRRNSCTMGVIDLGFTGDLSEILQTEYGQRMLSSQATHRVNEHIKYNDQIFPKVITFEKDFWITEMYDQIKKGNIRFPLGSYEQIYWLIQHCVNMEIKPTTRGGEISPHYVKSGNNDGFMALINAYIAYKWYISNGFKIKNPNLMNDSTRRKLPVCLGFVPRL